MRRNDRQSIPNRLKHLQEPKKEGGLKARPKGKVICTICRCDTPRELIVFKLGERGSARDQLCPECHRDLEARIEGHFHRVRIEAITE